MSNQQAELDALKAIDAATTKAANNLTTIAATSKTISDEMTALIASLKEQGVSQDVLDQTAAMATRAQQISDALDAHAAFLAGIASQGAVTPVPVPVPPAPPTV